VVGAGRQEALQSHHAQLRRQPTIYRAIITDTDKKRVEREKIDRFISGAQCRRINLDQEMDGWVDRIRCKEGEERCDVCQKSDAMMEEAETLRQAYIAQQEKERYQQEPTLDSGIDIPSSQSVIPSSSPTVEPSRVVPPSSPPVVQPDIFPSSPKLPYLRWIPYSPSKSPSSNIISSEAGFETNMVAIAEAVEFQSQQEKYKQDQVYANRQAQDESRAV
jgi:hypothetical protein